MVKTLEEFYIDAWRIKSNLPILEHYIIEKSIDELYSTRWSNNFEKYMRNRLVMGALRYGEIDKKRKYNYIEYLEKKVKMYKNTGNKELLVDIANQAMLEFMNCQHENGHFSPLDNENPYSKDTYKENNNE
jgi:hypothetical protein